jgi:molybdate transport system substrate-binding protein
LFLCPGPLSLEGQNREAGITVFAASSLTDAFREIGAEFERQAPGATVRFNFAGSQQLAAQIELAGGADVFASADERWMNAVRDKALFSAEPRPFVGNSLVVVLPVGNPASISTLQDLARPGIRLVLAGPAVPAGKYSREVIEKLAASPGFPPGYALAVFANVVSHEENVRAVLGKVLLGEADAGIVYRTDFATTAPGGLLRIEIPGKANVIASYLIAPLRPSVNQSLARRFVEYVCSPPGQAILERFGFLRVPR